MIQVTTQEIAQMKFTEKQIQIILFLEYIDPEKWVIAEINTPTYYAAYVRISNGQTYHNDLLANYESTEIKDLVAKKILIETSIPNPDIHTKYYKLLPVTANIHNTLKIMTSGHKLIK